MPAVLVHAEERSIVNANAPTSLEIANALRGVARDGGQWIGPTPRVTRRLNPGEMRGAVTHAAWVMGWPDNGTDPVTDGRVQRLRTAVQAALDDVAMGWQPVEVIPYSVALHGPLSWWNSGEAAITQTQDQWPELGGRFDAAENPIGPTTALTHPTTVRDQAARATSGLGEILTPLVIVASLGLGVYALDRAGLLSRRS